MTFQEYLAARGAALVRIARLLTADDRRADIVVRDVLVRAYPRWNDIAKSERPDVYLRRMLVDRERWRRPSTFPEHGEDSTWRHIASRPRCERAAIVLHYHEDLDDAVIAEILDTSPAAVRADRRRALARADESGIRASLRERAGAPVDLSALIAIATRDGRARSRRRRTVRWAAAATAVVLAVVGAGLANAPRTTEPPFRFDGIEPYFYADTRLPRAPGVPGARSRPDLVGTDPAVLHFDAPALTNRARWHTWTTAPGYERLEAAIGPDGVVYTTIGKRAAVDAVAEEENLRAMVGRRLAGDLWLRVEATSDELARVAERAVNLAEAQRCVLPYRLPVRPRGSDVATCYVGFRNGHYALGGLVLRGDRARSMEVQAQYVPGFPNRKTANHRCGDRPAVLFPGGQEMEVLLGYQGFYLSARLGGPYKGYAIADADAMLAVVAIASDVEQIRTWPASPINP